MQHGRNRPNHRGGRFAERQRFFHKIQHGRIAVLGAQTRGVKFCAETSEKRTGEVVELARDLSALEILRVE